MVRLSARDLRTSVGTNVRLIEEKTGLNPWIYGNSRVKANLIQNNISEFPKHEEWRLPLLDKYLCLRTFAYDNGDEEEEATLNGLIHSLVTT